MQPMQDTRREAQPSVECTRVCVASHVSRAFLASSRLDRHHHHRRQHFWQRLSRALHDRESWAPIRPSAIPDLPFLQADWS